MWSWWIARSRWTTAPSWWHLPQVNGIFSGETGEAASFTALMSCMPWQEEQVGASTSPRLSALPWSEAACCFASASWQSPQFTFRVSASWGSSLPESSAWQLTHCRLPWIDAANAFSGTYSDTVRPLRSAVKSFCPWQPRQSPFSCARTAAGTSRTTARPASPSAWRAGASRGVLSIGPFSPKARSVMSLRPRARGAR